MERGVEAEIERQAAILDGGGRIEQQAATPDPRTGSLTAASARSTRTSAISRSPTWSLAPPATTAAAREGLPTLPRGAARALQGGNRLRGRQGDGDRLRATLAF